MGDAPVDSLVIIPGYLAIISLPSFNERSLNDTSQSLDGAVQFSAAPLKLSRITVNASAASIIHPLSVAAYYVQCSMGSLSRLA